MKTQKIVISKILFLIFGLIIVLGCDREETLQPKSIFEIEEESAAELDVYLKENFRVPYGTNVVYKFVDQYVNPRFKVVPTKLDVVKPSLELIKKLWIDPYIVASDDGEDFLKKYFPAEIILLGDPIVNADGTRTGGIAEGGVRITLADLNGYAPDDKPWTTNLLRLAHHEFAHIIDQNFIFDVQSFYDISGEDYTSPNTWTTISDSEAIARGMVTAYGSQSVAEDFAELVSLIITMDPSDFEAQYLTLNNDCGSSSNSEFCLRQNEGKKRIKEKYDIVVKYFKEDVRIDLLKVRDEFLTNVN